MNICPVGAEVFHANGQTDRHDETLLAMVIYVHTNIHSTTLLFTCCTTVMHKHMGLARVKSEPC